MSRAQRDKGKRAELEAADLWRESGLFPDAGRRASGEESTRDQGRDLHSTGKFIVQVKNARSSTPHGALAEAAAAGYGIPIAMLRRDRLPFVIVMRPGDFFALVAAADMGQPRSKGHEAGQG